MLPSELRDLQQQHTDLSDKINQLTKIYNGNLLRAGCSFCTGPVIGNIPKKQDYFFSFWTPDEIPPELKDFVHLWVQRLIAERNIIWHKIENSGQYVGK